MSNFIHLNLHTEYSVANGLVRIKPLIKKLTDQAMPAVAITDLCNLFATVKLYKAASAAGIKPIIGAELWLEPSDELKQASRFLVLCQDYEGYKNLSRLITLGYREGQESGKPLIRQEWLTQHAEGLIILSGAAQGEAGQFILTGNRELAKQSLCEWQSIFPDRFYVELQRTGHTDQELLIDESVDLAAEIGLPVVATNAVCFLEQHDFEAHEARVCINEGRTLADTRRTKNYTTEQYLRSSEEMQTLFADIPEAIDNTVYIAQRCNLELNFDEYFLPDFPIPEGNTLESWFRSQSREGLEKRLDILFDRNSTEFPDQRKAYDERLDQELKVILEMGFPGYFLIVADFIRWGKENDIPVGPGRGSGAGSLVAYALKITDLDPLEYDLLFERFLNPERVSMPDFDIDFCMDRRDEVIDYVARTYGRDHVSQIITHGTMAAKAVVRDAGRVLGLPYGFVDQIAKMIPFDLKMTLKKALEEEEALRERYEQEEEVQGLIDLGLQLEGTVRNVGKHAGGVVIAPSPMTDFLPLYCEPNGSSVVCQFDMIDVETIGLVKFDFLGLRTLTIIDWAVKDANALLEKQGQPLINIDLLPLDDKATFDLVRRAETTAVFQLESRGMKELIKRLRPDTFEDLIALVALFRPGPLQSGMVDDFVDRKHGRAAVEYPHPDLEPILKPTYGTIVYQEQVMQTAQVLAGYSLGAADMLRRAMGKKKAEEMAQQRVIFTEGASGKGVDKTVATDIFDMMEKFAEYGFNKSHSAAYALVAYQTAWLKAHYPAAFMAAVLSSDMDNTDKVVGLIDECRQMKIDVVSPDVNVCFFKFTVKDEKTVCYGLGAIKGVGESAVECITEEREKNGAYKDLFDFGRRLDTRKVNRRVFEAMIKSGAFDPLGPGRSTLFASLESALKMADQHSKNRSAGQNDMFGLLESSASDQGSNNFTDAEEWTEEERLTNEKVTLGLYLSGHPIDRYEAEISEMNCTRLSTVKPGPRRISGMIFGIRIMNGRRGRMAIVTLDDKSARVDVLLYSEALEMYAEDLVKDRIVVVEGQCNEDRFSGGYSIVADKLSGIDKARSEYARQLLIDLTPVKFTSQLLEQLQNCLQPYKNGSSRVLLKYQQDSAQTHIRLGKEWRVQLPDRLLTQLSTIVGSENVHVEY